jgi:hypothetical protein
VEGRASRAAQMRRWSGENLGPTCGFYSRARRWNLTVWQWKLWAGNDSGAAVQTSDMRSGRRCSDRMTDTRTPLV